MTLSCIVVLLACVVSSLGIIDLEPPVTKPPRHRENLPWPSRPAYGSSTGIKSSQSRPYNNPPPAPTQGRLVASLSDTQSSPSARDEPNNYQPPKLPVVLATVKQPLCPYKATGQFPYAPDCRRFINCYRGRGVIQMCAPGTLFNALTQECDFPAKVTCLETRSDYRIVPGQQLLEESNSRDEPSRNQRIQNEDWKMGFKSYKVTRPPDPKIPDPNFYIGYTGGQPQAPNYFQQPVPSGSLKPPPPPVPSPMLQPPPVGYQFNIPPILNSSPNSSRVEPFSFSGPANPVYVIPYQISQNRPGYPLSPVHPVRPINSQDVSYEQSKPPYENQNTDSQIPPKTETNPPPLFTGGQQTNLQNQPRISPEDQLQNPSSYPHYYPNGQQYYPVYVHQTIQDPSKPQSANANTYNRAQSIQNPQPQIPEGYSQPQNAQNYPQPQNPQGYPQPQSPQGYPQPQNSLGYPQPQSPQGYPHPQSPRGYPQPQRPLGYPQPQSPQGYPQPQSPQGYPHPQSPRGYSQPQNAHSYPQPQSSQGYPQPQNTRGYSQPQIPQGYAPPQNAQGYPQPQNQPVISNPNNLPKNYEETNESPDNSQGYSFNAAPNPDSLTPSPSDYNPNQRVFPPPYPGSQQQPDYTQNRQNNPSVNANNPQPASGTFPGYNNGNPSPFPESISQNNPQGYPNIPAGFNINHPHTESQFPGSVYPSNPGSVYSNNPHSYSPNSENINPNSPQGYPANPGHFNRNYPQGYPSYPGNFSVNSVQGYPLSPESPGNHQPYPGAPSGRNHPSYPQSREPDIFPQGGQPGYFLVNQNPKEADPVPRQPPPKQNPTDSSRNSVKCPPGASGLYPHPDCTKFLSCDHGRTFIMSCGPGTAFNPDISVCDFPHNVNCGKTPEQPEDPTEVEVNEPVDTNRQWDPIPDKNETGGTTDYDDENPSPSELVEIVDVRSNFDVSEEEDQSIQISTTTTTTTVKPTTKTPNTPPPPVKDVQQSRISNNNQTPKTSTPPSVDTELDEDEYIPATSKIPPRTPKKNIVERSEPPPISMQLARLRGGHKASEGYLEMRGLKEWGMVCDKAGEWTVTEANIVCKQLGFERGAELTWQGRPTVGNAATKRSTAFSSVWCNGNETNILDCTTKNDKPCHPEREAVWIRCYDNPQSQCMPGEASYKGRCYNLVVPREDAKIESVGFSQGEALAHCQLRRGHLLDITSQEESDFISEWLVSLNTTSNLMTSGVGVSVMGASIWIWEGSSETFKYSNWWPGWDKTPGSEVTFPGTKSNRALCVIARRYFPCPTNSNKTTIEDAFCDAEYFFWDVEDCAIMSNRHPYVCERLADDVGCVKGSGQDYTGHANVTETSTACLPWETDQILAAMKYRVSETTFRNTLAGHNYCRNVGGSDTRPWCYVASGLTIKKEACDIPVCRDDATIIATQRVGDHTCGPNLFFCELDECIPSAWVCDGQPDCKNGYDEQNCTGGLSQFQRHAASRLMDHDKEKWLHTSAANCATRCLEATDFVCRSFSHYGKDQICLLSESNVGLSGKLVTNQTEWDYYERISHSIDCSNMFQCSSGKCINQSSTCNGKNDCGDRSDERNCSAANLGYEIRLGGGKNSNEGRVEIKILGEWGYVCDDQFDLRDAEVVCHELGFNLGAAEVRSFSMFTPLNTTKPLFLVDDLQCRGNESSIRECDFGGWGIHDCGNEEVVGVVCKVPGLMCANKFWQCERSGECIPINFLCDSIPDCNDGSDEEPERCKQPVVVRLAGNDRSGSLTTVSGRVEVRRFGIWGTVCDDDFGDAEAAVVCQQLGYKGPAKSRKEAAFGEGEGIIWLDGVHCAGNESSVDHCLHDQWGQSDCKHQEDVSVVCSHLSVKGKEEDLTGSDSPIDLNVSNALPVDGILPENCGIVDEELKYATDQTPKVVNGQEIKRGTIPWQASLRVRTSLKSVHWCGAVIISPLHILTSAHCLVDYTKSAYFVRVGDFDTEVPEGSEQEHDIESVYIHEDFDKGRHLSNDLAVILLKGTGLRFSSYVRAVCLPPAPTVYVPSTNCTISGWGSNGSPGAGYSRRLRATTVPIIAETECRAPYVYGDALSPGMFCAGDLHGGSDSCQGDSGGPFVCPINGRSVLHGVTSWGHGCGRANKPGVYTKVAAYISWIHAKIYDSLTGK